MRGFGSKLPSTSTYTHNGVDIAKDYLRIIKRGKSSNSVILQRLK